MNRKKLQLPLSDAVRLELKAGDLLALSGVIYTARDAAHKRMIEAINDQQPLPFDLQGQTIYYSGPCPACPGQVIGSAGPTTSGRMDLYTPALIEHGLRVMIGKGQRSDPVIQSMIRFGAVYLGATGGAGALLAQHITEARIIAYPDLGTEAIRQLVVKDFPVLVIIDSKGNNLYDTGPAQYRQDD